MAEAGGWTEDCRRLLAAEGEDGERKLLASLALLFDSLVSKEGFRALRPRSEEMLAEVRRRTESGDVEGVTASLVLLYAYLHGSGGSYTEEERSALDAREGYWCHAGGLSPLWRARPHIHQETRSADYGAGNGLQGLLLQHLYPHRRTTLIELGGGMIEEGRALGKMMGIPDEQVRWIHGSVEAVSPRDFDFIYIYRPMKPEGEAGRRFYRWFADELAAAGHPVTIFSIADCLRDHLDPDRFEPFYDDGQLTCFSGGGSGPGREIDTGRAMDYVDG